MAPPPAPPLAPSTVTEKHDASQHVAEKVAPTIASRKSKGKAKETVEGQEAPVRKGRSERKAFAAAAAAAGKTLDRQTQGWAWRTLAESSVSSLPVVFTADGNYFFSVSGSSVKIYSASSGKVVSTLASSPSGTTKRGSRPKHVGGHTDKVTSVVINPANQYQVITSSLDGSVKIWDFLEATLLRTIIVGSPVEYMCAHGEIEGQIFVATKLEKKDTAEVGELKTSMKDKTHICRVSLSPDPSAAESSVQKPAEMFSIGRTRSAVSMSLSHNGAYLVVIGGFKAYVAMTSHLENGFTKFVSPERLKCLACHPSDDFFATGDEKGQVRLWYCLSSQIANMASGVEKRAQTTTLHWHAHSISTIAFTPNGAYLLTGGEESVLVIWQLQSGRKEFVPRMGSPIVSVAVRRGREEEYLVGLSDGTFAFIGASTLAMSRSITRVKFGSTKTLTYKGTPTPLAYHPQSSTVLLPSSHPSSLQIYSPQALISVGELEVAPSNRVSKRDEKPIEPFVVERLTVSPDGLWMASVDRRENEHEFSSEVYLKIWHWESNSWTLNTRVDRPHGAERIMALSFRPQNNLEPLLMTAGSDGFVKIWRLRTIASKTGQDESFWVNRSRFQFRSGKPTDGCWSSDGSLLAICYSPHIVLLDPSSNVVIKILDAPEVKVPTGVRFVGSSGRYLMVYNNREVAVWDLVSHSVLWTVETPSFIFHALPHPKQDAIALILHPYADATQKQVSTVQVYECTSEKPTVSQSMPFRLRACSWFPDRLGTNIIGVTDQWNVVLFGDKVVAQADIESIPRRIDQSSALKTQKTLFEDVFGSSALNPAATSKASKMDSTLQPLNTFHALSNFSTPAYLAPSIDSLYSSVMEDFVSKAPLGEPPKEAAETQDDDEMVIDAELPARNAQSVGRSVDDEEFNDLVALFRKQSILSLPLPKKSVLNGTPNGKHSSSRQIDSPDQPSTPLAKQNGLAKGTPNTTTKTPKGGTSSDPASTSPVDVGKKRKPAQIS